LDTVQQFEPCAYDSRALRYFVSYVMFEISADAVLAACEQILFSSEKNRVCFLKE
jgi:hypothetical protein